MNTCIIYCILHQMKAMSNIVSSADEPRMLTRGAKKRMHEKSMIELASKKIKYSVFNLIIKLIVYTTGLSLFGYGSYCQLSTTVQYYKNSNAVTYINMISNYDTISCRGFSSGIPHISDNAVDVFKYFGFDIYGVSDYLACFKNSPEKFVDMVDMNTELMVIPDTDYNPNYNNQESVTNIKNPGTDIAISSRELVNLGARDINMITNIIQYANNPTNMYDKKKRMQVMIRMTNDEWINMFGRQKKNINNKLNQKSNENIIIRINDSGISKYLQDIHDKAVFGYKIVHVIGEGTSKIFHLNPRKSGALNPLDRIFRNIRNSLDESQYKFDIAHKEIIREVRQSTNEMQDFVSDFMFIYNWGGVIVIIYGWLVSEIVMIICTIYWRYFLE
jgi:hypothetical protein